MLGAARRAAVQAAQAVSRKGPEAAGKALDKAGEFAKKHPHEVYRVAKMAKQAMDSNRGGEPAAGVAVARWPAGEPVAAPDGWGVLQWALVGLGLATAITAGVVAYRRWKGL